MGQLGGVTACDPWLIENTYRGRLGGGSNGDIFRKRDLN